MSRDSQEIYQMVRWIAKNATGNQEANQFTVFEVNEHVNKKLSEGFRLFQTHYLGETPEAYGILYVLVR